MNPPTLCIICETVGGHASIGKIARQQVETALAAGWKVAVVANQLDAALRNDMEWLKLYVPPRGFAIQWLTGRHWIKRALGKRTFDVVHGHQPQIADLCDVYQCHFLTRVAYEHRCLYDRKGFGRWIEIGQKRIVLAAEDYFYQHWNPSTLMLYNSDFTRSAFERLYGIPQRRRTLILASPAEKFVTADERDAARLRWLGSPWSGIVAGFLGGLSERKGYRRVVRGLAGERDIFLLMGGPGSVGFKATELADHMRSVGECQDVDSFYAACDVLLVPSFFEPFGFVISEAIARGVPVIASDEVGALPHVLEHGAGARWRPAEPLAPLIRSVVGSKGDFQQGCARYNQAYHAARQDGALLEIYREVAARKAAFHECKASTENRFS